ncbi:hypothetical protein LCGC14_0449060 [marine sediment metagenome]|uniref:Uncharacterized protein n=1 Tax=marine sediment metagenome TaxID=412755 RepID=A0A0F9SID1_9ZZZZ
MTVFSRAWMLLEDRIDSKTSWGKNEIRNEMFLSLRDAALEEDKKEDTSDGFDDLLKQCLVCGARGVNMLIYRCTGIDSDGFHKIQ